MAVAKVEELTRQLEELRRGRAQPVPPSAHELDKLRRELMVSIILLSSRWIILQMFIPCDFRERTISMVEDWTYASVRWCFTIGLVNRLKNWSTIYICGFSTRSNNKAASEVAMGR